MHEIIVAQPNDTRVIRARNRAICRRQTDQRRTHAIACVMEHLDVFGAYVTTDPRVASAVESRRTCAAAIVDAVNALMRGGELE